MKLLLSVLVYFGVATILAEGALLGVLSAKGLLSREKSVNMLAVVYDVDLPSIRRDMTPPEQEESDEQYSPRQVAEGRNLLHLDLDLRELGADKGWNEMRELRQGLEDERSSYQKLKTAFDERIVQLQKAGSDAALRDVQTRLESMNPKQAKEQVLKILADRAIGEEQALDEVVAMVKAMPLERRKKLLTEFKSEDEAKKLHAILKRIRQGASDVTLIRETRDKIKRFAPTR